MNTHWTIEAFRAGDAGMHETWHALAQASGGSPVLLPGFVFACARTIGSGSLVYACCRRAGQPVAAALIRRHGGPSPELFVESQMPLGAWIQAPGEDFPQLVQGLLRACGPALRFGAAQLDPRFLPRPEPDARAQTLDYIQTAWVELDGDFDAYWKARGKNLRTNMRRQREKLAAQGVATRMEIFTEPADIAQGVADYAALESRGWKAELGTAVSEDHPQTVFYREMLEGFAAKGQARIYRYFFDDRLVATEFALVGGTEMVILKTTHDESVNPFSPASLLRQEMFEALFQEGRIRRLEFYGPLKEWHTRWTAFSRTIYHANFYRFAQVQRLEHLVRKGLRRGLPGSGTAAVQEPVEPDPAQAAWSRHDARRYLAEHATAWDRLNAQHASAHPVFDARFVRAALEHFGTGPVQALVLGDPAAPQGVVLLESSGPGVWCNFQRSQMQISPVLLPPEAFHRLAELFRLLPMGTLAIEFLNQDRAFVAWPEALTQRPTAELMDAGLTGSISLAGSFDDYWSARPRKLRTDIAAYLRRLAAEGRPVRLEVVEDVEPVVDAVRAFGLMESRGWKARGGTAVHPDNAQGRFYAEVFEAFARTGQAIGYALHAGDAVIARQLALVAGPMMLTLKTTYDERFRHVAPGRLLDYEMLRHEFARRRFSTVELCTRADDMQLRWATAHREVVHVSLFRSAQARAVFQGLRQVARGLRSRGADRRTVDAQPTP